MTNIENTSQVPEKLKLDFKDIEIDDLENMDERAEVLKPSEIAALSNSIFARKSE